MKTYYDNISKSYNQLYGEEQKKKLDIIKDCVHVKKSYKLLDVGCGTGISSDFDCKVIGIDPSKELLKIAQKKENNKTKSNKNKNKSSKKRFIKASAESLPFKDNYFDIVISLTAIHNFTNIEKALQEMKRVGKNIFIISILKKSKKLLKIQKLIKKYFKIQKKIIEHKDVIYFLS